MQILTTTLSVRLPIGIDNMERLSVITAALKYAYDAVQPEKDDGSNPSVSLTQRVTDDAETATPAPRRRGPNRAKSQTVEEVKAVLSGKSPAAVQPDTSKPGTEVTQPAWRVQAGNDPKAEMPGFLNRGADNAKTKAA